MSWRTKDSRVRTTMKRMSRDSVLRDRQPLWEQRGNNPANHIGYVNKKTRDIFTTNGNYSVDSKVGHTGLIVDGNNAHQKRVAASVAEDFTYRG
jgi:hypothetical protein